MRVLRTGPPARLERALCAGPWTRQRLAGALCRPGAKAGTTADRRRHAGLRVDAGGAAMADTAACGLPAALPRAGLPAAGLAAAESAKQCEETSRNVPLKGTPRREGLCKPARAYP